jgi:hypothetical protein
VDAEIIEILKAKRDAVQALEEALKGAIQVTGMVGTPEGALALVRTWREAMDAMVPAETTIASPPKTLLGAIDPNAVHYREDFSGPLTACDRPMLGVADVLFTDDVPDVTCEICQDKLKDL